MRDGLTLLADLVERLEVGEVAVEDASLTRSEGAGFDVDLSVHIPADAEPFAATRAGAAADEPAEPATGSQPGGATADGQAGGPTGEPRAADGPPARTVPQPPADFGSRSVRVGASLGPALRTPQTASGNGETPETPASSSSTDERFECRVAGCTETFETEHGMKIHATKAHREADGSAPSPHRNPERLREVYEACETFEEMTEALGVDVTAQTVRRSMMALGIHDPGADRSGDAEPAGADGTEQPADSDGSAAAAEADGTEQSAAADGTAEPADVGGEPEPADLEDAEEPTEGPDLGAAAADGGEEPADGDPSAAEPSRRDVQAALPDDVDAEVLVTAVREASTLFQVQRAMGMQRGEVQTLLAELGLLEMVTGRVATEEQREVTRAEVERRILERAGDDEASTEAGDADATVEAE